MSTTIKLKDESIAGTDMAFMVDEYGRFRVVLGGGQIGSGDAPVTISYGYTLDEAVTKARVAITKRKIKVAVPFITIDGKRGIATGLHAGNGSILARVDDESIQLGIYDSQRTLRADMPKDQLRELRAKEAQIKDLSREIRQIRDTYKLDLKAAVEAAIAEAQRTKFSDNNGKEITCH